VRLRVFSRGLQVTSLK
jgi:hypothetical protein